VLVQDSVDCKRVLYVKVIEKPKMCFCIVKPAACTPISEFNFRICYFEELVVFGNVWSMFTKDFIEEITHNLTSLGIGTNLL
jgi:hypothetical protein